MKQYKELVSKLYNNKKLFVLVLFHFGVGLLFYIGLFMPFIKHWSLINGGSVPLSMYLGSNIFEIPIFLSLFVYLYFMIVENNKWAKRTLLIQLIICTIFHLYGALIFRFGSDFTLQPGFGRYWTFFFLVIMYVKYFQEGLLIFAINQIVPGDEELVKWIPEPNAYPDQDPNRFNEEEPPVEAVVKEEKPAPVEPIPDEELGAVEGLEDFEEPEKAEEQITEKKDEI